MTKTKQRKILVSEEILEDMAFTILALERMLDSKGKNKGVTHEKAWGLPNKKK